MMSLSISLLPNLISCHCPVVYPSLINGYPTYNAHIQPHTQIQQLLFRVEKHNISRPKVVFMQQMWDSQIQIRLSEPMCVCVCVMTTTEFGLLWLSDVKAGVYKAGRDLSVKRWGAWGLSLYKSINPDSLISFFGKKALKILTHKHAIKSHRKSGLESL